MACFSDPSSSANNRLRTYSESRFQSTATAEFGQKRSFIARVRRQSGAHRPCNIGHARLLVILLPCGTLSQFANRIRHMFWIVAREVLINERISSKEMRT